MSINRIGNPSFFPEVSQAFKKATNLKKENNTEVFYKPTQASNTSISTAFTVDLSSTQTKQVDKEYLMSKFAGKDKPDASFIEDYAVTYQKLRQEIMDDTSGTNMVEKLKLLDDVYKEEVAKAAKTVAETFEGFFDYSPNTLPTLNKAMDSSASVFDSRAFEKHLTELAMQALEVAKNNPDLTEDDLRIKMRSALVAAPSDNTLENMSYNDIRIVSDIIKELPSISLKVIPGNYQSVKAEDAGTVMAKWNAILEDSDKLAGMSEDVRKKVTEAIKNNIGSYHKATAYSNAMRNYDDTLKELQDQLKNLQALRKKLEGIVKQYKDSNMLDTAAVFLEKLAKIESQISGIGGKIKSIQESKANLEKDPNSVVNTEEYKQIKDAYKSKKDKLRVARS